MLNIIKIFIALLGLTGASTIYADVTIPVFFTAEQGFGKVVGTILIQETPYGLLFTPNLHGLKPGIHGFHIHQNPSCENNGMAAGGHYDPKKTNKHLGPFNDSGHLGDLPALYVAADGSVSVPMLAPRLKSIREIRGHSLMIHEGGDNYSDSPAKLGGGGARMVCGVIPGE
jgi:Cu-Zn family superoxide dismutase